MKGKTILFMFIGFVLTALFIGILYAGPTIIRDNRITDLATTPLLGRGYSVGTNTFQSSCLKDITLTEPSYDMQYYFESSQESVTESSKREKRRAVRAKSGYRSSRRHSFFGFGKSSSYGSNTDRMSSSRTTRIGTKSYFNHDVFVTLDLYSYYASVDEARSKLSNSAVSLLQAKDLPGFFGSCGPYYVRSIGRKARFISKFTYRTTTSEVKTSFETQLRTAIKQFSTESKWGWGSRSGSSRTNEVTDTSSQSNDFSREAKEMHLTITTSAYGLGKNEKATLISYDLDTFKEAVKDAFLSMQNPRTGRVSSIEVVPWVENTEFQALVKLEKSEDVFEDVVGADGKPLLDEKGNIKRILKSKGKNLYEKKMTLNLNAEFLMEIERVDRNLMNMYYKAKLCRSHLNANWKQDGGKGAIMKKYNDAEVENHRTGDTIPLKQLDKKLDDGYIEKLLQNEKEFMYGKTGGGDNGAAACIRMMMDKGISEQSYRDHKPCQDLLRQMGEIQDEVVENFCMPVLAD